VRANTIRVRFSLVFLSICFGAVTVALFAQAPVLVARYTATTTNVSGAGDVVRIELLKWSTDADRDQLLNAWLHPPTPPPPVVAQAPAAGPPAAGGGGGRGGGRGGVPPAAVDGAAPPRGAGGGRGGGARGAAPPAADGAAVPPLPAAAAGGAPPRGAGGGRGGAAPAPVVEVVPETPESSLAAALQKTNSVGILWTSESAGYSIKFAYRIATPDGGERVIFATDRRLGVWSDQWWKPTGTVTPTNLAFTVFELRLNGKVDGEGRTTLTGKVAEDTAAKSISVASYSEQPIVFKAVKKVR